MDDIAKSRSQLIEDAAKSHLERMEIRSTGFELLQQQTNFEHLIYTSQAAIITFHSDGTLYSFSAGAERLFGYDELDVVNRCINFLTPDIALSSDGLMDFLRERAKESTNQWLSPIIARHADNSLIYLTADVSEVVGISGFQQMLVVFHDITKPKMAELEYASYTNNLENLITELNDELRISQESATNAGFAERDALAFVVHELSEPLDQVVTEATQGLATVVNKSRYSVLVHHFEKIESAAQLLKESLANLADDELLKPPSNR